MVHAPALGILKARKRMNDGIRRFFDQRGFLEVETPIAVRSPGIEPHLEPFSIEFVAPNRSRHSLFLQTSPEFAMKRLLASGTGSIYQLARVFRNGESSNHHTPEFTMLEFYRSGASLAELSEDVVGLVRHLAALLQVAPPAPVARRTVSELFAEAGLMDPLDLQQSVDALSQGLQVAAAPDDDWEDVFFKVFLERVESLLPSRQLTLLSGYPARMAALSELDPGDDRKALRMEVYWGQLELGNAYQELTDPAEQRRRFESDNGLRLRLGRTPMPIDQDLLADLPAMGRAAGIAIGTDRLLMKLLGLRRVQDVLCFPVA
ncbi:MAG: EF-P lysine aminoacylase EpmA [Myxococcota bacterium]